MKAKNAKQFLRDANKEMKSLSGVLKIVKAGWSAGYKQAFAEIGITFDMLDYKKLEPIMQRDKSGVIYTVENVRIKDADGNYVKDEKGHYKKEQQNVPVKLWTANKLFDCLKQSMNK